MVSIKWSFRSQRDLESIYSFIRKDSPRFALQQVEEIVRSTQILQQFPTIGRVVAEFEESGYRELVQHPYRIIYRFGINSNSMLIVAIHHSRRKNFSL